tara:strand:- start:871 stop:1143 length:273 start_codon:yes stop_codon:yes gene_type:complete
MKNLKDQLAGIAALIAAIIAIGGGFVKYGEITTQLETLSEATPERSIEIEENSGNIIDNQQAIKVLQTEMELLKLRMKELKELSSNPLGN